LTLHHPVVFNLSMEKSNGVIYERVGLAGPAANKAGNPGGQTHKGDLCGQHIVLIPRAL